MRKTPLVLVLIALAAAALPATAAARSVRIHGTVVKRSAPAHTVVVALRNGRLRLVHTRARLRVGRVVTVRGTLRADGSITARKLQRGKLVRRVRVRGVVIRGTSARFTVAANGATVTVRRRGARRAAALDGGNTVQPGQPVVSNDQIDDHGDLAEVSTAPAGTAAVFEVSGTVVSVQAGAGAATGSLVLNVDGVPLTLVVPPTLDVSTLAAGSEVEVRVAVSTDAQGVATLTVVSANAEDDGGNGQGGQGDGGDGGHGGGGGGNG